jgi:enamine deaminase RidA (YjgF/YER057c/UK114 family)
VEAKLILLLIGIVMGAALVRVARRPQERRYFKGSNLSLDRQGLPVPYSDAVLAGNTMYVAGRIGTDPNSGAIPQDIEQEVRFLLDSFKAALAKGGMTMSDVVMVQVYCPDLSLYNRFNAVYRTYFTSDLPARAFLGSGALLGGAHFEMLGTAVRR